MERATEMAVPDFAQRHLFDPLGIKDTAWQFTPSGVAMTGGSLGLRSRDLLKLGQLYLNGGEWSRKRVISEEWVRRSLRPQVRIDDETEYGYLWWLKPFSSGEQRFDACYMSGIGGNKVVVFPSLELVVVVTSINYRVREAHQLTDALLTEFVLATVESSK